METNNFFGTYQNNLKGDIPSLSISKYENIFKIGYNDTYPFYNLLKTITLPTSIEPSMYKLIKTLPNDTWTNLSYIYYNNIDLWWLIALVNNVFNPFEMPKIIKIIHPEYVDAILNNIQQQLQ